MVSTQGVGRKIAARLLWPRRSGPTTRRRRPAPGTLPLRSSHHAHHLDPHRRPRSRGGRALPCRPDAQGRSHALHRAPGGGGDDRHDALGQRRSVDDPSASHAGHGFIVGHVTPEAYMGGPIGLLRDGDLITINAETLEINCNISAAEFEERRKTWTNKDLSSLKGTLKKYMQLVSTASEGCITDNA